MRPADEELAGKAALDALAERWALHDGRIRRVQIETRDGFRPSVSLEVLPRAESQVVKAEIRVSSVTRLDVAWNDCDSDFYFVAGYKALLLESGRVYLSLDPYDDRAESEDERDCFVVEGETVAVRLRMKA